MRVRNGRLLEILLHAGAPSAVRRDELHLDAGAVVALPLDGLVFDDVGLVAFRVEPDAHAKRGAPLAGLRSDDDGLARRELGIETRCADPDPLLPAALTEPVKLRPVEELREDLGDLRLHDPGAVVLDDHAEARFGDHLLRLPLGWCSTPATELDDLDEQLRQDAGFFASIERVVDGLFHRGEQGFGRVVKPEQMAVLGEELRDGDVTLLGAHRLRGLSTCGFVRHAL